MNASRSIFALRIVQPVPSPLRRTYTFDGQTLNHYSYVRNNPLRYTDPSGYTEDGVCDAACQAQMLAGMASVTLAAASTMGPSQSATAAPAAPEASDAAGATTPTGVGSVDPTSLRGKAAECAKGAAVGLTPGAAALVGPDDWATPAEQAAFYTCQVGGALGAEVLSGGKVKAEVGGAAEGGSLLGGGGEGITLGGGVATLAAAGEMAITTELVAATHCGNRSEHGRRGGRVANDRPVHGWELRARAGCTARDPGRGTGGAYDQQPKASRARARDTSVPESCEAGQDDVDVS